MDDELYYQVRDCRGFPVTTCYNSIAPAVKVAKERLAKFPDSYITKNMPWGVVKITVHKIGLLNQFNKVKNENNNS